MRWDTKERMGRIGSAGGLTAIGALVYLVYVVRIDELLEPKNQRLGQGLAAIGSILSPVGLQEQTAILCVQILDGQAP